MEWPEVQRRIRAGEDASTEFKRNLGDMRAVTRTLCAFANGAGGLLVLGIDDTGAIVGVESGLRHHRIADPAGSVRRPRRGDEPLARCRTT